MQETQVQSLSQKDPLEKERANHYSILAWRIPWTEESGGLQSMSSQRVRHDWEMKHSTWSLFRINWASIGKNLGVMCLYKYYLLLSSVTPLQTSRNAKPTIQSPKYPLLAPLLHGLFLPMTDCPVPISQCRSYLSFKVQLTPYQSHTALPVLLEEGDLFSLRKSYACTSRYIYVYVMITKIMP